MLSLFKVRSEFFAVLISPLLLSLISCTSQISQTNVGDNANKAKLIITRSSTFTASVFSAPVYVNNTYIGKLGNGGTVSWLVKPGQTVVSTTKGIAAYKLTQGGQDSVTFNAAAGKVYQLTIVAPYQIGMIAPAFDISLN